MCSGQRDGSGSGAPVPPRPAAASLALHRLVTLHLPATGDPVTTGTFRIELDRQKLKATRRHEGQYLLRSNLTGEDPAELWSNYINRVRIQMLDVTIPATDGREVRKKRYTKPEKVQHLLLDQLGFTLPAQPRRKSAIPRLWWRPFEAINAFSTTWIPKAL